MRDISSVQKRKGGKRDRCGQEERARGESVDEKNGGRGGDEYGREDEEDVGGDATRHDVFFVEVASWHNRYF